MTNGDALDSGLAAYARSAWSEACALLALADGQTALEPGQLEQLATAAYLAGEDAASSDGWARAHQAHLNRGDSRRAARCAFWLAFGLLSRGETARAGGWLARAQRLLDDGEADCVERGYLLLPAAIRCVMEGDAARGYGIFGEAVEIGNRFADTDLVTLARNGCGRALIRMGEIREGVALLDEAMVAVEAGEVSPVVAGDVYCSMIEACHEIFDLRRAREWTLVLSEWCEAQPELVSYRGQCLVRRAEIMQLHGDWAHALEEAYRACERLSRPLQPAVGAAYYQRAELHRLRGEFAEAEDAYRQASRWSRRPRPGLAQLHLAQGQLEAARATIRRVASEAGDPPTRTGVLPAVVEIMLAVGDVASARAAADELASIAAALDAALPGALAAHADGWVRLAEGDVPGALDQLRQAWTAWEELGTPYEAARARVLIAGAYRELGDADAARLELDAARAVFERLGAAPDLARIDAITSQPATRPDHGLTPRELQVLRRVAAGKSNKAIAAALFISERTVERHVSNILGKLRVQSRAAATAFAYEHHLV
jgi:DNA-binding CsgD family transcriptional regulator